MKHKSLLLVLAGALMVGSAMAQSPTSYVPKVYPQQQETALGAELVVNSSGDTYTFRNSLFEAKFIKQNGTLLFGGCPQMHLMSDTELFTVKFGDGTERKASQMTLTGIKCEHLNGDDKAVKGSHHFNGEQLIATFTTEYQGKTITITWTAELREGSHYLKTNLDIEASDDVKMLAIIPMQYNFDATNEKSVPMPKGDSRLRGRVLSNGKMFACLDTPTAFNTAGGSKKDVSYDENDVLSTQTTRWYPNSWQSIEDDNEVPSRIQEFNLTKTNVKRWDVQTVNVTEPGAVNVEFLYGNVGSKGLHMVGVELLYEDMKVAGGDYHIGFAGIKKTDNVYSIDVKTTGRYIVRCLVENKSEAIDSEGTITTRFIKKAVEEMSTEEIVPLEGLWKRDATLKKGEPWSVGSVVGLMAEGQDRRSFLAYLERERAVPWRPFPMYNSWYEINIGRTNKHADPALNMRVEDAVRVVKHWKEKMFDKYGVSIKSFVWDDGWDNLKTWEPSCNFPNGFYEPKLITDQMCSHQGAWLGPIGGYDVAGDARKAYWRPLGGAGMHNPLYYEAFTTAVKNLCTQYDFNYYKFDGIGGDATAYAPKEGNEGNEKCEGIISLERDIRKTIQEDVFFNTTVGTWASPLWLNISDCVWRQDQDHYLQGNNPNTREQWITYRDNLIYEHFVEESPLMTINSMMSHGFILTKYGLDITKNMPKDFNSVLREMRCAFACGSSQVELYCDYELMDNICKVENDATTAGALWEELAKCIKWQRSNADVLPDIHWVGEDPYTNKENVYGWAAWNGNKATYTLRNGHQNSQTYKINLRHDLQIPNNVENHIIHLKRAFTDQEQLQGLNDGADGIDVWIDQDIEVTLKGSSVYIFDGIDRMGSLVPIESLTFSVDSINVPIGAAQAPTYLISPLHASNKSLAWASADSTIARVTDGAITGVNYGTTTITATALDNSGATMSITVTVTENKKTELLELIEQIEAAYEENNVDTWGGEIIKSNDVFSSNASDRDEGRTFPLTDKDGSTFWHSDYRNTPVPAGSHYLQVVLPTAVRGTLQVEMMRRLNGGKLLPNDNPLEFTVKVSKTGEENDWTEAGNLVFPLGSDSNPVVTAAFTAYDDYRFFRFYCTKTSGENRGYFHVGDFQLRPLEVASPNSTHAEAADAIIQAIADARKLSNVTGDDIANLQQAYETYLAAIGQSVQAVPTATITAVFPDGAKHIVYSNGEKLTAGESVPAGSISTFTVVSRNAETGAIVLKAGNKFLHITCGEENNDKQKMSDWDGLSEEENDWTTLTLETADATGTVFHKRNGNQTVIGSWDTPYDGLYQIKGKGSNNNSYYLTLRSSDDHWIASDPLDKYFDSNWNGIGCRTSFFEVTITEPTVDTSALDKAKAAYEAASQNIIDFIDAYSEEPYAQDLLNELLETMVGITFDIATKENDGIDATLDEYQQATSALVQALNDAQAALNDIISAISYGRDLPIVSGIYEIQNAPTEQDRGYLVDNSAVYANGPALAECHYRGYENNHALDRTAEGICSYWYVHEKEGKYYIVSLASLLENGEPRFLDPSGNKQASTYNSEPVALEITKSSATYPIDENVYNYMLIADAATPNYVLSASCGTPSRQGAVKTDDNKTDPGSPWKFIWTGLTIKDLQMSNIRELAIRRIEFDASIKRVVEYIDHVQQGKALVKDVELIRDIILKKQ